MRYNKRVNKPARFIVLHITLTVIILLLFLMSLARNARGQNGQDLHSFFRVTKVIHQKNGPDIVALTPMVSPTIIATVDEATANVTEHDILTCEQTFSASTFSDHKDKFVVLKCGSGDNKQKLKINDLYFGPAVAN